MRVSVGRGSVTVINATPFAPRAVRRRSRLAARRRHADRRGDDVHFLSRGRTSVARSRRCGARRARRRPRLAADRARCCGAAACVSARSRRRRTLRAAIAGRADPRHGTVRAAARRRDSLHAACVRALEEAPRAGSRLCGLAGDERPAALARAHGRSIGDALAVAHSSPRAAHGRHELRGTIALLEVGAAADARSSRRGRSHGTSAEAPTRGDRSRRRRSA